MSRTAQRHARNRNFRKANGSSADSDPQLSAVARECMIGGSSLFVVSFAASGSTPAHQVQLKGLEPGRPWVGTIKDGYVAVAARQNSVLSRRSLWQQVQNGLLAFLTEAENDASKIDDDLLVRFAHWLNTKTSRSSRLSLRTKRNYFKKAINVLQAGASKPENGLKSVEFDWRVDPWAGQQMGRPGPDAYLAPERMSSILKACRSEIERTMDDLGEDLSALNSEIGSGPVVAQARRIRHQLCASNARQPGFDLGNIDDGCGDKSIDEAALRLVMPTLADILPFLLLLAHYTGFNSSVLLGVKIDDIARRSVGEAKWTIVTSYKGRSDSNQRSVFSIDPSSVNPDRILRFLMAWTETLRSVARTKSLFVVRSRNRIEDLGDPRTKVNISQRVGQWLEARGLPHATFRSIRKGILDLAHLESNGDESAMRAIGGQRSPDVIANHYTSEEARIRDMTRLGDAMQDLIRMIRSDGKVDARRLPDGVDRSAATPGFCCADRHASPMPGEVPGRPCQSYGHCPVCPLAVVDARSPRACGYLHSLLERIEGGLSANSTATAATYIGTWLPVARRLRTLWLPIFSDDVREAAMSLELIKLPEIE